MSGSASLTEGESSTNPEGTGLTLLRLGLWTEEMRLKVKMMVEVVEDAKSEHPLLSSSATLTIKQIMEVHWYRRFMRILVMAIL